MNENVKVSVVMPAYNSEKYIGEAIDSIIGQTFTDWELIIINDGSKDNTAEVVKGYSDSRIRFIDNEINHGFLYSLNYGISIANGKYIARLDDDDVAYPDRFEKQVKFLDEHDDIVLVGGLYDDLIDGKVRKSGGEYIGSPTELKFTLLFHNCMGHSSFMSRKYIYDKYNIKYDTFIQTPDYHILQDINKVGNVACLNDVIYKYRIHKTQSTAVRSQEMKMSEKDRCRCMYIDSIELSDEDKYIFKKAVCRDLASDDDFKIFNNAFVNYAKSCGFDVEKNALRHNKTFQSVRKNVFREQKGSLIAFRGYNNFYARGSWWSDILWSAIFIMRCVTKAQNDYFHYQTTVDYTKPVERKDIAYNVD